MKGPSVHLLTMFFVVLSVFFIMETRADFYIEFMKGTRDGRNILKLFQCSDGTTGGASSSRARTPAPSSSQDILCTEVENEDVERVYSTVNFFAVTPRFIGNKKIKIKGSYLSNSVFKIFLGVKIRGVPTWPVSQPSHINSALTQIEHIPRFFKNVNVELAANFLTPGDFLSYEKLTGGMVSCFKEYGKALENVSEIVSDQPRDAQKNDVKFAVNLLMQRLIDPCYCKSTARVSNFEAPYNPGELCNKQCQFLSASFVVYGPGATFGCTSRIAYGFCSGKRCRCHTVFPPVLPPHTMILGCNCNVQPPPPVDMIECSNALRRKVAIVTNRQP